MRILLDENLSSVRLVEHLERSGHDVRRAEVPGDSDAVVLARAILDDRALLTRDQKDHRELHELVLVSGGRHPGILVVRFDTDPRHDMTHRGICNAIRKLAVSGLAVESGPHVLNHWQ